MPEVDGKWVDEYPSRWIYRTCLAVEVVLAGTNAVVYYVSREIAPLVASLLLFSFVVGLVLSQRRSDEQQRAFNTDMRQIVNLTTQIKTDIEIAIREQEMDD